MVLKLFPLAPRALSINTSAAQSSWRSFRNVCSVINAEMENIIHVYINEFMTSSLVTRNFNSILALILVLCCSCKMFYNFSICIVCCFWSRKIKYIRIILLAFCLLTALTFCCTNTKLFKLKVIISSALCTFIRQAVINNIARLLQCRLKRRT